MKIAALIRKQYRVFFFRWAGILLVGIITLMWITPMWAQGESGIEFEDGKVTLDAQERSLKAILTILSLKANFQIVFDKGWADRAITTQFSLPLDMALQKLLSQEEYQIDYREHQIAKVTIYPKDPAQRQGLATTPESSKTLLPGPLPPPPVPSGPFHQPDEQNGVPRPPVPNIPGIPMPLPPHNANPAAVAAFENLKTEYPQVMALWNPLTGFPSSLFGKLSAPTPEKPLEIAKKFFAKYYKLFGMLHPQRELQLDDRAYALPQDNMPSHILYRQQYEGIVVYNHSISIHISPQGIVEMVEGNFLSGVRPKTKSQAKLTLAEAVRILRGDIKDHQVTDPVTGKEMMLSMVTTPTLAWYAHEERDIYLTWYADVTNLGKSESHRIFIDANSGKVIAQERLFMDFRK